MKFTILSDVHGDIELCRKVCAENPNRTVLQLGDLGVGFVNQARFKNLPLNFKFFVGNHDNRQLAKTIPNYLGDFGEFHDIFFVSGADSIDKDMRVENISWWANEELSYAQCEACFLAWKNSKCEIIISHDVPQFVAENYLLIYDKSRTRQLLQAMIEVRKPKLIVAGHHHSPLNVTMDGIQVHILEANKTLNVDPQLWKDSGVIFLKDIK